MDLWVGCELRHRDYCMVIYYKLGALLQRPQLAGLDRVTTSDTVDVGTEWQKLFFFFFKFWPWNPGDLVIIFQTCKTYGVCCLRCSFLDVNLIFKIRMEPLRIILAVRETRKAFFLFTCTLVRHKSWYENLLKHK